MKKFLSWFKWPQPAEYYPFFPPAYVFIFIALNLVAAGAIAVMVVEFLRRVSQ